jgi:glycosyltransferase involved in cell wall biosynthesis
LSAPANCRFLGVVSDQQLRWLYANCIGLVSAAHEDFGLAPLEAMAFGQPVAVLRSGGFIETVRDGETGTFFDNATPRDAARAIGTMISSKWSRRQIEAWADSFSVSAFSARIRAGARELVGDLATTA